MKRLKSSRLVKMFCFVLCILFTAGVVGNIILVLLLQESNVYYAEKDQLNEILLEDVIEHYNQSDIRIYLCETIENSGPGNHELEIYQNKFSKENSNLSFTVTDQDGNTVLSNFSAPDKAFTFTKTISVYNYDLGTVYPEMPTVPPETTIPAEADTVDSETEPAQNDFTDREETTAMPEPTTLPPQSGVTEPATETTFEDHVYILDENVSGYRFRYYYDSPAYNGTILQYCISLYEANDRGEIDYAQYDGEWMTFYESHFAISDNGVVYYTGGHEPTTYIQDVWDESNTPHTDYEATYTLPKTMAVKDLFYYAQRFAGFAYGYIHKIIPLTVCFALASLLFFILSMLCAGHVKGEAEPKARALHRIPYDLVLLTGFCIVFPILYEIGDESFDPIGIVVGLFAVAFTLFWLIETTVVRCKAKTIGKNFIVVWLVKLAVRFIRFLIALFKKASENMNLLWKLGLLFGLSVIAEFAYSMLLMEEDAFLILWIILKILMIPVLLWHAACWNRLQNGARNLSEGHITQKVNTNHLFGEFKKNAEYLNAINEGVNAEVQKRMKSESMKTELITNVSHDLKTPLTSIINYVDLLKGTEVTDPKAQEYIEVIDRQSQRLKKLCADIVDASKAATGNLTVNRERTVLNVMLGQVIGEYDARLKAKSLQLISEIPQDEIAVQADGRLLWRVFDNLMGNICKYAMEGTRVYLSLGASSGTAQITFRNISGAPLNIPPEEITERFVRGDTSRNSDGSGLGLSIAKSLTELMDGQFDVSIDGDLFKVILHFPATA